MRGNWMPWPVIVLTAEGNQLGAAWNWERNQNGPDALFWKTSTKGHEGNRLFVVIWFPVKAQQ